MPGIPAHVVDRSGSRPAKEFLRTSGITPIGSNVTFATLDDLIGHGTPACLFESLNDLENAVTMAAAEVDRDPSRVAHHIGNRLRMTIGQVHDVDEVSHAGAVGRWIVVPEDTKTRQRAMSNASDIRKQIVRNAVRILADEAGRMRADRIEVAQADGAEVGPGAADVGKNLLDVKLGAAVGVGRFARRAVLREGQALGRAVHGRGGAEDETRDALPAHGC